MRFPFLIAAIMAFVPVASWAGPFFSDGPTERQKSESRSIQREVQINYLIVSEMRKLEGQGEGRGHTYGESFSKDASQCKTLTRWRGTSGLRIATKMAQNGILSGPAARRAINRGAHNNMVKYTQWGMAPGDEGFIEPVYCWIIYGKMAQAVGERISQKVFQSRNSIRNRIRELLRNKNLYGGVVGQALKEARDIRMCRIPSLNGAIADGSREMRCGPLSIDYNTMTATYANGPVLSADGAVGETYTVSISRKKEQSQSFTVE